MLQFRSFRCRSHYISKKTQNPEQNNYLLASLSNKDLELLRPHLEIYELRFEAILFETGQPIEHVYFPTSGIISLLAETNGNSTLEVGVIGNEGVAGISAFLGATVSSSRAIVQGSGSAFRIKAATLVEHAEPMNRALLLYTHYLMVQISQSAACYRFHPIEQRLARWLLMTGDRMESNEYRITQEFMSNMLGVRREAVNRAAGELQKKNLISFSRRNLVTIDRAGLQETACSCYQIISEQEKVLKP